MMFYRLESSISKFVLSIASAALMAGICWPASGATLCVNPAGSSGCQTTIAAALKAAAAGDTIQVAAGTYKEEVTVTQPLSLIGEGSATTIIDATGLSNGIFVDGSAGAPKSGVRDVVVSGFTVENANYQGILVQNAAYVTVTNNQVVDNDKKLNLSTKPACSGLPAALQSGEALDCGEGIHLTGVDHSVVSNNVVENNSGGILVSDDTGATHDNLITNNLVTKNIFDCGITLASHSSMGVYHNTVSGNQSLGNGTGKGGGAGVGLFAAGPGNKTYSNVIIDNQIEGNGHPGISMHNHAAPAGAPPVNLDDNIIVGNVISGNGADTGDAATPGPTGINIYGVTPINGAIVAENVIGQESIGLGFKTPGHVTAYLNNFMGLPTAMANFGSGSVAATQDWWGCPGGPSVLGCSRTTGAVVVSAWLTSPFNSTLLPAASGGAGGSAPGAAVTVVVTGPGGATSTTNTFQVVSNMVSLDASKSTSSNGGALSYSWSASPGFPSVSMTGANTANPTIQLPSQGTYQFTLTITDSAGATATATITIEYI